MAIARVRTNNASAAGSGSTISTTLNGVAAGNLVVCNVAWEEGAVGDLTSVTDDLSAVAQTAATNDVAALVYIFSQRYFKNHGGGNRTFTANFSPAASFRAIVAIEYSGADTVAPLDQASGTAIGNSSTPTATSLTPAIDGSLFVGMAGGVALVSSAAPSSDVFQDSADFLDTEDYIQTSAAAFAQTWSMASGDWGVVVGVYKPSVITVVLSGTVTASITESDIVAGGKTIILTLSGDTWIQ